MELKLFATSIRGRKAYKDDTGTLYLQCTKCNAIKPHYEFVKAKHGFLNKRSDCYQCQREAHKEYNINYQKQYRMKKAMAKYS